MNNDKVPAENDVIKSCLNGLQKVNQISLFDVERLLAAVSRQIMTAILPWSKRFCSALIYS